MSEIAWFGAAENFFLQAIAYTGVLVMIYWMHIPAQKIESKRKSAMANLKEGFAYVWSTPAVPHPPALRVLSKRTMIVSRIKTATLIDIQKTPATDLFSCDGVDATSSSLASAAVTSVATAPMTCGASSARS